MSERQTVDIRNGFFIEQVDKNMALAANAMYQKLEEVLAETMRSYGNDCFDIKALLATARGEAFPKGKLAGHDRYHKSGGGE